jgi:hypothetical protein
MKTALELGVKAETENISIYEAFLQEDLPGDVGDIFKRLMSASENHLSAFRNSLRKYE